MDEVTPAVSMQPPGTCKAHKAQPETISSPAPSAPGEQNTMMPKAPLLWLVNLMSSRQQIRG